MNIEEDGILAVLAEQEKRVAAIRMVGGISEAEALQGKKVPKGWKADPCVDYWVPPDFYYSGTNH